MQAKYIYLPVIDSTNNELKRRAEEAVEEFTVISAGQQTGGRGRSGHVWKSPSHDSVSTSMILYPKASVEHVYTWNGQKLVYSHDRRVKH